MEGTILSKIIEAPKNTYVIFYVSTCTYSQKALSLLQSSHVNYKGYDMLQVNHGWHILLNTLQTHASELSYDTNHTTKPIIFLNGDFVGGYTQLANVLSTHDVV